MRGAVLHAPGQVRLEQRDDPRIIQPTDAIIRLSATCICEEKDTQNEARHPWMTEHVVCQLRRILLTLACPSASKLAALHSRRILPAAGGRRLPDCAYRTP
jgi:hypothetical protein